MTGTNLLLAGTGTYDLQNATNNFATIAANEGQAEAFWLLRDSIASAERALGPALRHDISVPVDRMPDFVARMA